VLIPADVEVDMDLPIVAAVAAAALVVIVVAVLVLRRRSDVVVVPPRPQRGAAHPESLEGLLAQGKKIEAIKLVREQTGMGLKEAKDYVEAYAAGKRPGLPPPASRPTAASAAPSATVQDAARALVAQGKKIEAIKLVREQTGMGLKEAKDYVDRLG